MLDLERKIEKTIYKATLALDENNWAAWFELCDESFTYEITSFSPEINKKMTYFSGDKKELTGLMDMLPKHNTDHSPLHRHTSVYSIDISDDGKSATAVSKRSIAYGLSNTRSKRSVRDLAMAPWAPLTKIIGMP